MLLLGVAAMSLSAYDRAQVEADAALIRAYEEESRIFKDLDWHEETTEFQWFTFYTLQAADVYSTYRGLKYDCIIEGNPLLGERPTVPHMITHKYVFLSPIWMLQNEGVYTKKEINLYNSMAGLVVYNNLRLLDRAKQKCNKR
jgi:hypothetical protein